MNELERQKTERLAMLDKFWNQLETVDDAAAALPTPVLDLLTHTGFASLLGLLQGERNGLLLSLAHLPLTSPENIAVASVTQGRVQGIDALRRTLVEIVSCKRITSPEGTNS